MSIVGKRNTERGMKWLNERMGYTTYEQKEYTLIGVSFGGIK